MEQALSNYQSAPVRPTKPGTSRRWSMSTTWSVSGRTRALYGVSLRVGPRTVFIRLRDPKRMVRDGEVAWPVGGGDRLCRGRVVGADCTSRAIVARFFQR